jgi:SPP1 family holin
MIPVSDEQITELITLVITIGASLWAWWKNNSFTKCAIEADEVLNKLKEAK